MDGPDLGLLGIAPLDWDPQHGMDVTVGLLEAAGFRPRDGSVEVALVEGHMVAAAVCAYAAGRVSPAVLAGLLTWMGVGRLPGSAPSGLVEVVLDPPGTLTVPAGLRLRVPASGDELVTTGPVAVAAASTVVLPVAAVEAGPVVVPVGTALDLLDGIPGAAAATVVAQVAGGTAAETDGEWMARSQGGVALWRAAVNHASQYERWTLASYPAGTRARAVDLWDPGSGHEAGGDGGHVAVVVWGPGRAWTGSERAALAAQLQGMSEAGKTVHVVPAPVTTVDLAVRVQASGDPVVVRDAVAAALRAWCDPAAWKWDAMVRVLDVAATARVPGVASVLAVDSPSADVPVPGPGGLARAGTVTVVVGPDTGI